MISTPEKILILDFGAQYTQLIARRIRELGVYSEIVPFNYSLKDIQETKPKGIILSGGPSSVHDKNAPHISKAIFTLGIPILGICYGQQLIAHLLGGQVRKASNREYGHAVLGAHKKSPLFEKLPHKTGVWMSHGDDVVKLPTGFAEIVKSNSVVAAIQNPETNIYGVQFHPEVTHTQYGKQILDNFLEICGVKHTWSMGSFSKTAIAEIKERLYA